MMATMRTTKTLKGPIVTVTNNRAHRTHSPKAGMIRNKTT
jgi:hypothetical protein